MVIMPRTKGCTSASSSYNPSVHLHIHICHSLPSQPLRSYLSYLVHSGLVRWNWNINNTENGTWPSADKRLALALPDERRQWQVFGMTDPSGSSSELYIATGLKTDVDTRLGPTSLERIFAMYLHRRTYFQNEVGWPTLFFRSAQWYLLDPSIERRSRRVMCFDSWNICICTCATTTARGFTARPRLLRIESTAQKNSLLWQMSSLLCIRKEWWTQAACGQQSAHDVLR